MVFGGGAMTMTGSIERYRLSVAGTTRLEDAILFATSESGEFAWQGLDAINSMHDD